MAIAQGIANSFKAELAQGIHNFGAAGDQFYIALYTSAASLSASTTIYTTSGEVVGTGYTAGGKLLTNVTPVLSGAIAIIDFSDVTWSASTITARGALIYNATDGNKAIAVLDFGSDRVSTASDFVIQFPTPDSANAILRLS